MDIVNHVGGTSGRDEPSPALPTGAVDDATSSTPVGIKSSPPVLGRRTLVDADMEDVSTLGAKSDSEAETVLLPGVNGHSPTKIRKAIKLEDKSNENGLLDSEHNTSPIKGIRNADFPSEGATSTLGKRKRSKHGSGSGRHEHSRNGNSSGLSSVLSSPIATARSRLGDSDSDISKSPSPGIGRKATVKSGDRNTFQEVDHEEPSADDKEQGRTRRRRSSGVDAAGQHNQQNSELLSTSRIETNFRNPTRSTSPNSYAHRRSASTNSTANGFSHKKRKLPAPLRATRDRPAIEENSDDDSTAGESPRPRRSRTRNLATPPTGDSSVSIAKMPGHKKRNPFGRTPLANACEDGDIDKVRRLLQEKPEDLDLADAAGNTPLQCAALNGHDDVVKLLLDAGCDVHRVNNSKDSPLLDAVENGHLEVVKLLLAAGVNPKIRNQEGEEPINKIDEDGEDAEAIRDALLKARANVAHTHPSLPVQSPHTESYSSRSRRTQSHGRSTKTGEHQLYTSYNVNSLRSAAARGDLATVGNIMQVIVTQDGFDDPESLVAAARGGHDEVLQILLGFGNADPDPPPLERKDWEHATPMLAAIGSDNIKVIELLLAKVDDDRFDPTKRYNGSTYHEIARYRMGPLWEKEERLLKEAYDNYKPRSSSRHHTSNQQSAARGHQKKISDPDARLNGGKSKSNTVGGPTHGSKREHKGTIDTSQIPIKRGPGRPRKESSESLTTIERDQSSITRKDKTVSRGAESEAVAPLSDVEPSKPRRKLISGKDLKGEREKQRRASVASIPLSINPLKESTSDNMAQPNSLMHKSGKPRLVSSASDPDIASEKSKDRARSIKRDDSKDRVSVIRGESPAKRPRKSSTPPSETHESSSLKAPQHGNSHKRRRIEGDGKSSHRSDARVSSSPDHRMSHASSALSKETSSAHRENRHESKNPRQERLGATSESYEPSKMASSLKKSSTMESDGSPPTEKKHKDRFKQYPDADAKSIEEKAAADEKARKEREEAESEAKIKKEAEEEIESQRIEAARLERIAMEKRAAEEAIRREKELQEERQRREEERREEMRKAEEEKKRLYDEQVRLRAEEQERRKAAQREEQRAEHRRIQKEREAARLAKLPPLLRWFDGYPRPATHEFASEFRVMQGVRYDTIRSNVIGPDAKEQWLLNTQVALLLGEKDLQLSRYTAWERIPVSNLAKRCLWKVESERYTMTSPGLRLYNSAFLEIDLDASQKRVPHDKIDKMRAEALDLFLALDLFFVKVSDFMFIVPKFPHLRSVQMQIQYREIPPDLSWLEKLTFPSKWRADPDAESNFGFAPGAKTYVNGVFVHEDKPKLALTSRTPFPEQRVPRVGLRQVFPHDPDYERLCIEQGLDHLLPQGRVDHGLVNGIEMGNGHAVLVNGAIIGITPPESTNGEVQQLLHRVSVSEESSAPSGSGSGLGLTMTASVADFPNGV